jgi:hypothetical protein
MSISVVKPKRKDPHVIITWFFSHELPILPSDLLIEIPKLPFSNEGSLGISVSKSKGKMGNSWLKNHVKIT